MIDITFVYDGQAPAHELVERSSLRAWLAGHAGATILRALPVDTGNSSR